MNRRREPRHAIAVPTRLRSLYFSEDVGMTRDLSLKGARVTTLRSVGVGERVRLTLRSPLLGGRVSVEGRVTHLEPQEAGRSMWPAEVGIEFDQPMAKLLPLIEFCA